MRAYAQARPGERIKRMFAILGVFIIIGPSVGGSFFVLWLVFAAMTQQASAAGIRELLGVGLLYAVPVSYVLLAKSVGIAGMLVGLLQAYIGRVRCWLALAFGDHSFYERSRTCDWSVRTIVR